jgi:hypothetical protein
LEQPAPEAKILREAVAQQTTHHSARSSPRKMMPDSGIASVGATEVLREMDEKQRPPEEIGSQTLAQNSVDINKSSFSSVDSKADLHNERNAHVLVNKVTVLSTESNFANQIADWQNQEPEYVLTQIQNDPFDKVLLLKNIDNAILTSYRTLSKQNN